MKYTLLSMLVLVLAGCTGVSKKSDSVQGNNSSSVTNAHAHSGEDTSSNKSKRKAIKNTKGSGRANQSGAVVCTYDSFSREISVVEKYSGCSVQYTRDGESSEIGRGYSSSPFCTNLADRVKSNLESSGFKCN